MESYAPQEALIFSAFIVLRRNLRGKRYQFLIYVLIISTILVPLNFLGSSFSPQVCMILLHIKETLKKAYLCDVGTD